MKGSLTLLLLVLAYLSGCLAQEKLNIWLVAHTHDDTGWLMPIDDYYVYEVQYILDSVVDSLSLNPERKFIEVEMAFFSRWWNEQSDFRKEQTRRLVENGQLEFINGGWCMNDEAVPIYYAMIDQMTLGHEFLQSAFGDSGKPTIGWHVDPFGHSNVQPTLYKWTGFDAFYINRFDYREKAEIKEARDMEFIWEGSQSIGADSAIWTHIMDSHYCTPNGFNWEHGVTQDLPEGDGPPPIVIDPPSWGFPSNAYERSQIFVTEAKKRAAVYKTNNILIPFGCDFTFQNANMMFKNMDRLIETINKYSDDFGATARYSSLSDYAAHVKATNTTWIQRTKDFFPYADNGGSYWTGYFASRPLVKSTSRRAHGLLRNADFLYSLVKSEYGVSNKAAWSELNLLRAPNAVVQHHDGVTGTFRQVVGEDYMKRMLDGIRRGEGVISELLGQMVTENSFNPGFEASAEFLREQLALGNRVPTVVYNSLPWPRRMYVNNTVYTTNVAVYDVNGNSVPSQLVQETGTARYTLWFLADLPALGYKTYMIAPTQSVDDADNAEISKTYTLEELQTMENEHISLEFSNTTGLLSSFYNKRTQITTSLSQNFWEYDSYNFPQSSGAYIFRPTGAATVLQSTVQTTISVGSLLSVARQEFSSSLVVQELRLFKGLSTLEGAFVDLEVTVGPLAYDQEIITRFQTDIQNGDYFFSDNNGFEVQQRQNLPGGRPEDYDNGVRIAGNYYPAVSRAYIKDGSRDNILTVATQSTHGVASLGNGQLELMLHRRCSRDDSRGMNEPLDDLARYTALLRFTVENTDESTRFHQRSTKVLSFPIAVYYGDISNFDQWSNTQREFLTAPLPENLFLLSFNPRDDVADQITLRLFNSFEKGSHSSLAQPVTVNIRNLFRDFTISSGEERTLTLLNPLSQQPGDLTNIVLSPIQIRTFVASVSK